MERRVLTYQWIKSLYLARFKVESQMHILEALKLWKVRILSFRSTIVRQFNGIHVDVLCFSESFWSRHNFSLSTKCISFAWIWEYADNRCTIAYYMHAQWGKLFSKGVFLFFVIQICIYIFTRYYLWFSHYKDYSSISREKAEAKKYSLPKIIPHYLGQARGTNIIHFNWIRKF